MTGTLVGEKREGAARSRTQDGRVTYEEDYHFMLDAPDKFTPRRNLYSTPGLPKANVTNLGGLLCRSVNLTRDKDKAVRWLAACTFSSQVSEGVDPATPQQGDPTLWVPYGKVRFEPIEVTLRKDLDGNAWVNSSGQPFQNGLKRKRRIAAVQFTQFEPVNSSTTLDTIMDRSDTMNSAVFLNRPKYTLLLQVDDAAIGFYYGVRCWQVTYTIKYKPWPETDGSLKGGWYVQQLDAGYHYRTGSPTLVSGQHYYTGGTLNAFEKDGVPYVGLLNAGEQSSGDVAHYLNFRDLEEIDFNSFLKIKSY